MYFKYKNTYIKSERREKDTTSVIKEIKIKIAMQSLHKLI